MSRAGRAARKAARAGARGSVGERAAMGGGRELALVAPQPTTSQEANATQDWFGPGRPMPGIAPARQAGRRFDYDFGQNVLQQPRAQQLTSFGTLRMMADRHDLTRMAIEVCKDRMVRLKWGFGLVDSDDDLTPEQDARAARFRKMLRRPDGKNFWVDWLRMLLEDLLVIDAPSIFVRRTVDESEIVGLYQVDGATIKPIIDDGGREPEPPLAAYQQWIKGMPAWNYTSRQLIYRPRNKRVHTVYGFSPVEQILATINIALRRQIWQHAYFTNGNIPDSLIGVPSTWTPDQIRDFQDWFDALLTGNDAKRRGALFVPGEVAKSYVPTKDAEMFGAGEEWLARVVCFCFGIPHQALVKEVNRATADNAAEQAIEDGLAPVMGWVESVINGILIDQMGEEELEFRFVTDKPVDPKILDEIWKGRTEAGMADRNEWRGAVGMQPREDPEAEMLLYQGKPLGVDDQIDQQQRRDASGVFPKMPDGGATSPDGSERDESSGSGGSEDGGGDESSPSATDEEEEGASKAAVPFAATGGAASEKAARPKPHDPGSLTEAQIDAFGQLSPERAAVERRRKRLQRVLQRALSRARTRVVAAVRAELQRVGADVSKADEPETPPVVGGAAATTTALGLAQWEDGILRVAIEAVGNFDFIIDATAQALEEIAEDATRQVAAVIGPRLSGDLVDQVSERSVAMAEQRAAELVGRRILENGTIIDNPDARWAITESTRTQIHDTITRVIRENEGSDALIQALQDDHAFSPARAEMISRTEVADINSQAQMETYHAAEEAGVTVQKEWVLGPEPCEICQANADQGPIGLDETFDSGDDTAPAHPNCVCAVIPVVGDE